MELDVYKPLKSDCIFTTTAGPYNIKEQGSFIGDNIYSFKSRPEVPNCQPACTIIDFHGHPKFTLPLSEFHRFSH